MENFLLNFYMLFSSRRQKHSSHYQKKKEKSANTSSYMVKEKAVTITFKILGVIESFAPKIVVMPLDKNLIGRKKYAGTLI